MGGSFALTYWHDMAFEGLILYDEGRWPECVIEHEICVRMNTYLLFVCKFRRVVLLASVLLCLLPLHCRVYGIRDPESKREYPDT